MRSWRSSIQRDSLIEPAQNFLYVVADGMGGAEAGEMASAIAVGAIRDYVEESSRRLILPKIAQLLQDALEEANRKILEYQTAQYRSARHGIDRASAC